ncbi:MAG: hypothetical protein ACOY82_17130 [Pseudomonadota bacterium]
MKRHRAHVSLRDPDERMRGDRGRFVSTPPATIPARGHAER